MNTQDCNNLILIDGDEHYIMFTTLKKIENSTDYSYTIHYKTINNIFPNTLFSINSNIHSIKFLKGLREYFIPMVKLLTTYPITHNHPAVRLLMSILNHEEYFNVSPIAEEYLKLYKNNTFTKEMIVNYLIYSNIIHTDNVEEAILHHKQNFLKLKKEDFIEDNRINIKKFFGYCCPALCDLPMPELVFIDQYNLIHYPAHKDNIKLYYKLYIIKHYDIFGEVLIKDFTLNSIKNLHPRDFDYLPKENFPLLHLPLGYNAFCEFIQNITIDDFLKLYGNVPNNCTSAESAIKMAKNILSNEYSPLTLQSAENAYDGIVDYAKKFSDSYYDEYEKIIGLYVMNNYNKYFNIGTVEFAIAYFKQLQEQNKIDIEYCEKFYDMFVANHKKWITTYNYAGFILHELLKLDEPVNIYEVIEEVFNNDEVHLTEDQWLNFMDSYYEFRDQPVIIWSYIM